MIENILLALISASLGGAVVFGIQIHREKKRSKELKKRVYNLLYHDMDTIDFLVKQCIKKNTFNISMEHLKNALKVRLSWNQIKHQAVEVLNIDDLKNLMDIFNVLETLVYTNEFQNLSELLNTNGLFSQVSSRIKTLKESLEKHI